MFSNLSNLNKTKEKEVLIAQKVKLQGNSIKLIYHFFSVLLKRIKIQVQSHNEKVKKEKKIHI